MTLEQNKDIIRRVYAEIQDTGNLDRIETLFDKDVIVHDPFMGTLKGAEAYKQLTAFFQNAFPGHKTSLELFVAEGDYVVILHTHHATNNGPFMDMPPTGKTAHVPGLELYRLKDGKVIEFWRHDDDFGLLRQLGLIPQPQGA